VSPVPAAPPGPGTGPDPADGPLLDVTDLTVRLSPGRFRAPVTAVDRVSLSVAPGETLGVVGESGAGKSTLALAVLGLVPVSAGTIRFAGRDVTSAGHRDRRRLGRDLQAVFQDPYSALNPARTVGQALAEPLEVHEALSRAARRRRVADMLDRVGLPGHAADRYPAEFSGGQRQRIAIARALIVAPRLVICDEPVSALDLSVQAQILNLLADLQRQLAVSYVFISHDLAVVAYLSARIAVLRGGQVVESGPAAQLYARPAHPYTQALLAAAPALAASQERSRPSRAGGTQ
jgi:ABC-type glutathione transport system ATPase component